ncbi:MAG: TM2 domain-containing protein [Capnocytophaga sp.]|nr:TM2 domain-containing protein [Capnocytophaga sp.]
MNQDEIKKELEETKEEIKQTANEFSKGVNDLVNKGDNKKMLAGILGILLGYLGIHKFVLGYTKEGVIQIIASVISCGALGIIGFIEGIIYLTKSDEDFYQTYQVGRRPWF